MDFHKKRRAPVVFPQNFWWIAIQVINMLITAMVDNDFYRSFKDLGGTAKIGCALEEALPLSRALETICAGGQFLGVIS